MRNISLSTVRKILLLSSVLVLMLTLCGCRTRITNNDEVSNVMYDEEGIMQDEYNMRRDELGLGRAPTPIFTGFGAPDTDEEYDYGSDSEMLEDYDPDDYTEEPYEDTDETVSPGRSSGNGTASQGSGNTISRRSSSGQSSSEVSGNTIKVVLDGNGGTIEGNSSVTVKVKKNGKYGEFPEPDLRDGYAFTGWYTKSSGGTEVTEETKVATSKKHRLYAHWMKIGDEAAVTHKVTFDTNAPSGETAVLSGNAQKTVTVTEGGTYKEMPSAECTGYSFLGWFTAAANDDGSKIENGSKVDIKADQTLYAHWDKKATQEYWDEKLEVAVKGASDIMQTYYISGGDDGESFLNKSGMKKGSADNCNYIVFFGSKEAASEIENPSGKQIIVIPKKAIDNSTKESERTAFSIKLFTELYSGSDLNADTAAEELGVALDELKKIDILPAAEASAEGGDEGGE